MKTKVTIGFFKNTKPHRFYMEESYESDLEVFDKNGIIEEVGKKYPSNFYQTIEVNRKDAWDKWLNI